VQLARGFGNAVTTHAEHVGNKLLGHGQLIGRQAAEGQQQPAAQLLIHRVMAIAHRGLGHLRDQGLRIAQKQELQLAVAMELILEMLSDQTVGVAGALHDRPARGDFTAHEQRDADEAFVADDRDFRRRAVCQHIQQRNDAVGRKINMAQDIAGLVQNLAERHRDEPQVRVESFALRR